MMVIERGFMKKWRVEFLWLPVQGFLFGFDWYKSHILTEFRLVLYFGIFSIDLVRPLARVDAGS